MPVYLQIKDSEGNNVSNTNSLLGVFDGPNLVGRLTLVIFPSGPVFMGPVYGSQPSATGLTIQLYNAATDSISTVPQTLNFKNRVALGSPSNPSQAQTIDFPALGSVNYSGGLTTNLGATASSGLLVSYSTANTNLISISSNVVTVLGAGTATIIASQSGSSNYLAATSVTNTLVIGKGSNTMASFTTIPTQTYSSNATVGVTLPTTSSGLPVSLSVVSGPATISGNTLTLTGTGTVVLAANQVGNSNYLPATQVTTSFTVAPAAAPVKVPVIYMEGATQIRKKDQTEYLMPTD
jgi:hypothetical protein